ncbi:hypothetical protein MMC22_006226 [Lobaria immixta]|nr:hypothetical protein [Lobaria immixta]
MPPKRKLANSPRPYLKRSRSQRSSSSSRPPPSPSKISPSAPSSSPSKSQKKASCVRLGKKIRAEQKAAQVPCPYCAKRHLDCWVGSFSNRCAVCAERGRGKASCGVDVTQHSKLDENSAPSTVLAEIVPPSSIPRSLPLDQPNVEKQLAVLAAEIEDLHKRLDDVVDDVTRLFSLRNKMAKNVNRLHETLINS